MAPEIADSDGETDIIDNDPTIERNNKYPAPTTKISTAQDNDSPPQIDFDQFVDPTQTLSEQSPQQHDAPGTGSTEKMLQGLAGAQKNLAASSSIGQQTGDTPNLTSSKGKRRHSASDERSSLGDVSGKKKRVKTYGSKPRSGSTIDLCADDDTATPALTTPFISADLTDSDRSSQPGATEQKQHLQTEHMPIARERDRPRRVISLMGQHGNTSGHQVSTTMSSYGGYQSIELDFRGGSNGLNIDANPFDDVSQVSVREEDLQPDVQTEMMTSPERPQDGRVPDSINPMLLMQSDATETTPTIDPVSKRRKTDNLARGTTTSPAPSSRRAASVSAESVSNMSDRSQPKKRGRRPKSSKLANSPQPETMAPPEMLEAPPSRRSRRGTLDSSQLSHDEIPSNTKRKRKKSKAESKPAEDSPTKHPSSELHLDDEKLIGLPKENYKPRPSRRRSRQTVDDDELQQALTASLAQVTEEREPDAEQSSPTKHPSSDLHLDDELVIGLPKENYKPRPSRRRSCTIDEEDPAKVDLLLPHIQEDEVHNEETPNKPTAAPSQSPPKTKKAKKSKVKRAKTSAAALLKKSSQMLSDGEDDVLWVDSKPAAVKLDLPPEIKLSKSEEKIKPETSTPKRESKISVEIPVTKPDGTPTKPDEGETICKKKRGRPKKSPTGLPPPGLSPGSPALDKAPTPEPLTDVEAAVTGEADADADPAEDEEEEDDIKPTTRIRAPLASKTPNAQSLPATPTLPTKLPASGKENQPVHLSQILLSPTKQPPPPPTSTSPSSTTVHSPIRPSPAWNSLSKYRVGLSKRQSIPSLLRKVDKTKAAPSKVGVKKLKERKLRKGENADADTDEEGDGGANGGVNGELRDKDGNLVEWEF